MLIPATLIVPTICPKLLIPFATPVVPKPPNGNRIGFEVGVVQTNRFIVNFADNHINKSLAHELKL